MDVTFAGFKLFQDPALVRLDEELLAQALRLLINANVLFLVQNPGTPPLYDSDVWYKRIKTWQTIPQLLKHGSGDCKDLAAWRAAEWIVSGVPAQVGLYYQNPLRTHLYHALVELPLKSGLTLLEDPSKVRGMTASNGRLYT